MIMIYTIALIVVLTDTSSTNTLVYSMPTWQSCVARKAALIEGMKGKRDPEAVTVDCRHDVQVNLGVHRPKPKEADATKKAQPKAARGSRAGSAGPHIGGYVSVADSGGLILLILT